MRLTGLFGLVLATSTQAGLIVGTADVGTGNCFPFGCTVTGPGTIYQQVYAPGAFAGTIDITSLSFFRTQFGSPSDVLTSATYTVKLSYSAQAVDALDTTTFSNNVGAGQVTFGTYTFTGVTVGSGLTFVRNNSDFVYDPLTGPLLVEIDLSSITFRGTPAYFDVMFSDSGGLFSRAQNFGATSTDTGLVTGFNIPEPATLALSGAGLLAVAFLRGRRNSARRSWIPPGRDKGQRLGWSSKRRNLGVALDQRIEV